MSNPTDIIRADRRLRRCIEKNGRGTSGYLYHSCCGPHYFVTRDEFSALAARLANEGVIEILDGVRSNSLWFVRKDLVDSTIADGVTL
jgi:hypothetical protein